MELPKGVKLNLIGHRRSAYSNCLASTTPHRCLDLQADLESQRKWPLQKGIQGPNL